MLNQGKRTIKTMQQILPSLVTIGTAKAHRMVRQFPPFHQKQIAPRLFQAGADFNRMNPGVAAIKGNACLTAAS
jgi:hypothetical protein